MPRFDANGLIPAIVQHARSGEVLMLGYMNEDALHHTQTSGLVTFWSRSRQALWKKGETSGNWLRLVDIRLDCDSDALLVLAEPDGPTCHTGQPTCFHRTLDETTNDIRVPAITITSRLTDVIASRIDADPEQSYTAKLLRGGIDRIAKKVGEEAAEVIIAAKNNSDSELTYEVADLFYHTLVLLTNQHVPLEAVWKELVRRATTQ
jgi:phosphoribosyl-ATP pyrophosphohydrolase/phosphoribosyl-AMP cyclohydrolase